MYCLIFTHNQLLSNRIVNLSILVAHLQYQTLRLCLVSMIFEGDMAQAKTLTDVQLKRALRYCSTRKHTQRDKTILLLTMNTGLRAKEVAALRFGDVFDEEQKPRTQFTLSKTQTKGARTRTVFVNKQLAQALADYQQYTRCTDAAAPLFRSQKGGHFSANTMCQLFLNIFHACGLKGASSHSPRRTFITRLANKGIGVRVLAELAGHSSIAVTQRYIDVNDEQMANAVELL